MKTKIILTPLLLGLISISFFGCHCSKQNNTDAYSFIFNQPDGSIPTTGWAIVYEKHLDPNTGYATLRVPISDTLTWDSSENGVVNWLDIRENKEKSISIHSFSPDEGTNDNLRHVWAALDRSTPEVKLTFPQSRNFKVVIRSSLPLPSPAKAWALYVSPDENPPDYIDGSNITTSEFHCWGLVENNRSVLASEIEFTEFSILFLHLFRLGDGVWHKHGRFTASIDSNTSDFLFTSNHSMSCCD